MMKTRTQRRGTCIYCGKQHALSADSKMVAHGYTIEWHQQLGNCSGVGRVHLGHKDAPKEIQDIIASLKARVATLPEEIEEAKAIYDKCNKAGQGAYTYRELNKLKRRLNGLISMQKQLPGVIESREKQLDNWKEKAPLLVDLDVEEAEQRKERQAAAQVKKEEKVAKELEKQLKAAEREAKSKAKWDGICSENLHQLELEGEVIAEWTSSYSDRDSLERDHYKRTSDFLASKYDDPMDRFWNAERVIHRVREPGGKNKQLHKF